MRSLSSYLQWSFLIAITLGVAIELLLLTIFLTGREEDRVVLMGIVGLGPLVVFSTLALLIILVFNPKKNRTSLSNKWTISSLFGALAFQALLVVIITAQ